MPISAQLDYEVYMAFIHLDWQYKQITVTKELTRDKASTSTCWHFAFDTMFS